MIAALLLLAQLAEAKPIAIDSTVAPEPFTLGEVVEWKLTVEHEARDVYTLPETIPQLTLSSAPETKRAPKGDHVATTFLIRFTDTSTLDPKLPDLTLHVQGPDGPRQLSIRGRPLQLRSLVKEEGEPNAEHAHHGPKPPVPVIVRAWLWLGLLLTLGALVAAFFAWRWWQKRRLVEEVLPAAPPLLPEDEAIKQLVALREKGNFGRATIFAVSEITRTYLGERYHFNAIDLTSEELLDELRRRELVKLELRAQLEWQDLVKFAKLEPTQDEARGAIEQAIELVNRTRPPRQEAA